MICHDCEQEPITAYCVESAEDPWDWTLCASCLRLRYMQWAQLAQDDELHLLPFAVIELLED